MPVCRMLVEERKSNEHVEFCFAAAAEAVSCDARSVLSLVTHSDGSQKRSLIISDCRRCSLRSRVDFTMVELQLPTSSSAALLQRVDDQTNWDEVRRRERGRGSVY